MAIDTTVLRSRRAILAGALAAIGASTGATLSRALPTRGANGEPLLIGANNVATELEPGVYPDTRLNHAGVYNVLSIRSFGTGDASRIPALSGTSDAYSGVGVAGSTSNGDGLGNYAGYSTGVRGTSPGIGVHGAATAGGTGVLADCDTGFALETIGRLKLGTSGVATIAAGETSITVPAGVPVTNASFALLTPRANLAGRDLWFGTDPASDTLTIRISSARTKSTKVSWLLLG